MRKTILITLLISVFMISCKEGKKEKEEGKKASQSTEMIQKQKRKQKHKKASQSNKMEQKQKRKQKHKNTNLGNAWVDKIKLNKNRKWKANSETTEGVKGMLNLIKSAELETVEDYHKLASKLNEKKNSVVKKCTMKGPSHDNLHVFLHPLIEKIGALGKVSTVDEGSEIKVSIKENLEGYYNYFQ